MLSHKGKLVMKIAVNTRLLLKNKLEGIGWFTYEVLKRLTHNNPLHEFVFIFDRPFDDEFIFSKNVTPLVVGPQARHAFLFYQWFERSIPRVLKEHKPDVFFSPDGYLSLKSDVPQIQVIHDLAFEHYPNQVPFFARKHYQYYFPKYAKKARHILTVSEYSKRDIVEKYGVNSNKISVVYNGASELYCSVEDNVKQVVRNKYAKGNPYFIYVGSINSRKNLGRLLQAFDEFCLSDKKNTQLLIVGDKMWNDTKFDMVYQSLKNQNRVVFTGRLEQQELAKVLASALALTYVSLFEGFGIPIVEAMKCSVPVITSNTSSMPEVAGDAALIVDPISVDSIKRAMIRINEDELMRSSLIEKGRNQALQFSWDKTAEGVGRVLLG